MHSACNHMHHDEQQALGLVVQPELALTCLPQPHVLHLCTRCVAGAVVGNGVLFGCRVAAVAGFSCHSYSALQVPDVVCLAGVMTGMKRTATGAAACCCLYLVHILLHMNFSAALLLSCLRSNCYTHASVNCAVR